ncbi:hypothetical protein AB0E08_47655 [Streptomyces sp. NPDC048281]|uniref:hypothetical protein n=1 Tax=Streptomyces sp. NPDC048281 TaxID=3154715 RepID=UPI0034433091
MQQPDPDRRHPAPAATGATYVDEVTAGPGGVMTDDVGVITGDLTVRTIVGDDGHSAHTTVQYTGAEEWYTLTGSPVPLPDGDLAGYHQSLLDRIRHGHAAEAT